MLALLAVVAVLGERDGSALGGDDEPVAPSAAALSVYDGRSPSESGGNALRVLVELPRPALADRDDLDALSEAEQRAYVRSLEREGTALRSALGARGVELRDAVPFGRTWDGFAATVDSSDLAALSSLGVRARPVRRFYPATSEPIPVPGTPKPATAVLDSHEPIAILDTGAQAPGYDALDRDDDPSPGADVRSPARRETTGDALAQIVTAAGERTLTIRVAGYGPNRQEIHGTTDTLLAGLERAVDPDGDGAVDDAVRVALVGVNAPYAAFADSAEAQAVRGAGKLGTLVVAPAGNEGPARPPNGVRRLARRSPHRARGRGDRGRRGRPARRRHDRRARAPGRDGPRRRAAVRHRAARRARSRAPTPPRCCAGARASETASRWCALGRTPPPRPPRRPAPGRARSCSPTPATARCRCCPPAAPPRRWSG